MLYWTPIHQEDLNIYQSTFAVANMTHLRRYAAGGGELRRVQPLYP
jgi:hypothetical protein